MLALKCTLAFSIKTVKPVHCLGQILKFPGKSIYLIIVFIVIIGSIIVKAIEKEGGRSEILLKQFL